MNKITQSSIESLLEQKEGMVISIYLPTHRHPTPPHIQEDQIRYKNLINQAQDQWQQINPSHDIDQIHQRLESKIDDLEFWRQATEGLAVFASNERLEFYHLPIECDERVFIGQSYDLMPLIAMHNHNQPYYLLAVAMHDAKLFKGDMYGLEPVEVDFPHSPEDALNIDEMFINSRTVRSRESSGGARSSLSPHGEGDSQEAGSQERLQYFKIIDGLVADSPNYDSQLPVLIAGTDSEAGDYKNISQLPKVMDTYLQGNHTKTSLNDLHHLAWQMIKDEVGDRRKADLLNRFNELRGPQKASCDMRDITEAAGSGRVDTLLVDIINVTNDTVSDAAISPQPKLIFNDDYDSQRINQLAHMVYTQGGSIFALDNLSMPENCSVSAIYRY